MRFGNGLKRRGTFADICSLRDCYIQEVGTVDTLINDFSAHPVALMILVVAVLLLLYFLFRGLLKLMLITGLVLIALCGYSYYRAPDDFPGKVRETIDKIGDQSDSIIEAGKGVIEKGKGLADKLGESVTKKKDAPAD
jgi:hypothetical protein